MQNIETTYSIENITNTINQMLKLRDCNVIVYVPVLNLMSATCFEKDNGNKRKDVRSQKKTPGRTSHNEDRLATVRLVTNSFSEVKLQTNIGWP